MCKLRDDTIVVLIPAVDAQTGRSLSHCVRDVVKNYHFRLDATGPEVLVTASFGFTRCFRSDDGELALNRAGNALARSQKRGRNQRHVDDGRSVKHCVSA